MTVEPPRPCAVEHDVPRQHGPECPGGDCKGCRQAMAAPDATVCRWHVARTTEAIAACPDLVGHLREHVEPGSAAGGERSGTRDAPAPLSVTAVAAADDLHAALASWVLLVFEEHPDRLRGPAWYGTDIRPASTRRLEPAKDAGRQVPGQRVYEPARAVGIEAGRGSGPTTLLARWLLPHLPWALRQPWAGVLADELPKHVGHLRAQWPTCERPVALPLPCPGCNLLTLQRHAPSCFEGPITITCPQCTYVMPEQTYGMWTKALVASKPRHPGPEVTVVFTGEASAGKSSLIEAIERIRES